MAEEQARREAEEKARREAEEKARREAEERARQRALVAAAAVDAGEDREDSVREFLDQQRLGWGAKFAAVFEEIGLETTGDLLVATKEEMAEVEQKLTAMGAGSFHLRQIRGAVAALRGESKSGHQGSRSPGGRGTAMEATAASDLERPGASRAERCHEAAV